MKFLVILVALVILFSSTLALAGGGKVRSKSPVFTEECIMQAPGIDLDNCILQPASPQSGFNVYFCETDTVVTCVIEEE